MKKALVGFAGFGGPEIALREAGIETVGIENDSAIAAVNRVNGGDVIVSDILDVDPADFIGWRLFHFSPPCPRFSVARNSKAVQPFKQRLLDLARHQQIINGETEQDIRLARKICEFIRVARPFFFTLENVWGYQKSLSWHLIQYTLLEEGYGLDTWNLNAADYGVPQSRRRMIVIARRDGRRPAKPWPTHSKTGDMFTQPWRGWYEAIQDLIPSLPESQFAPWQLDRLPEEVKTFLANNNTGKNDKLISRGKNESSFTVVASLGSKGAMPKALLVPGDNTSNGVVREADDGNEPADTVTANSNQSGVKALIIAGGNSRGKKGQGTIKDGGDPISTVTTHEKTTMPKALLVGGKYQTPANGKPRVVQNRGGDRPVWTIIANENLDTRALIKSRVISMTPRALARFQDFPDWFVLPENRTLACRGIGNALPPSLYRAVLKSLDLHRS